ncbi:MAG: RidA family protein [Chromatiales bacterium]|nr:RidA family protein [Chromatiales bacterium]
MRTLWMALIAGMLIAVPRSGLVEPVVEFHRSPGMAAAGFPLSEAVRVGDTLYLSGQLGTTGRELAPGGIGPETRQTMLNIGRILEQHGLGFSDLVRCIIFLADIDEWPAFNEVYREFFDESFPARSAVGGVELVRGARVEVDCIAAWRPRH